MLWKGSNNMEKKTFLNGEKHMLVSMVQADNPDRIKELIDLSFREGADALGMQFCKLKQEYRNTETYKELFAKASPLPVYVTNYREHESNKCKSDDTLAKELIEIAECGATLCDVMGDYFDACEGELTMNESAVKKQMKLIDELHVKGAQVLMSSHVHKFISLEQALKIAHEHQQRGADICKIVTRASDMAEQIENMRIIDVLKKELKIPFVLLCGGECNILRRVGGAIGNCMSLCVYEHDAFSTPSQPLLRDVKIIKKLI